MKHKFIAKRYWKDKITAMSKSGDKTDAFDDLINLSLGDPDIVTPSLIIDKSYEDARAGHTKYTHFRGDPELREEICKFYDKEYGLKVRDEEVFVTASACLGMYLALEAVLDDGDEVIIQAPYFTPYPQQVELARGIPVELPTYEEEDFQINIERLESLITERTKVLIINSPNNPAGSCLSLETLKKIAEVAEKHDLLVIADEIYTDYSYENEFIPFISIDGMAERTITINSFSKNYVMTGWRVGNIIAPECIVNVIRLVNDNVVFTAPSFSQRAAIHALRHREEVQKEFIDEFRERTRYAAERINKIPKLHTAYPPKGTFYVFVNIKETGMTSEEAADYILEEAHVLMLPGSAFGTCGEGYLRIACTVGIDKLGEAFDRIEKLTFK